MASKRSRGSRTTAQQRRVVRIAAQELREFKRNFAKASLEKDRAMLGRLIHDSFTLVDPQGKEVDKKRLIDDIVHPTSDFKFQRSERRTVFHSSGRAAL